MLKSAPHYSQEWLVKIVDSKACQRKTVGVQDKLMQHRSQRFLTTKLIGKEIRHGRTQQMGQYSASQGSSG